MPSEIAWDSDAEVLPLQSRIEAVADEVDIRTTPAPIRVGEEARGKGYG
jgi:hypothetical protein